MNSYYVYILASKSRGTLYIGVTNNLRRRYGEHQNGEVDSFTKKYRVTRLVYYESAESIGAAIQREKQLKNWHRQWKIGLIESNNPQWRDLGVHYRVGPEINSG